MQFVSEKRYGEKNIYIVCILYVYFWYSVKFAERKDQIGIKKQRNHKQMHFFETSWRYLHGNTIVFGKNSSNKRKEKKERENTQFITF